MNRSTIQGQIIRPFSPAIGKYKLPNETISLINTHVDGILKDQNKIDELYNGDNLAGEIKYEVKITKEFLDKHLFNTFKNYVFNYVKSTIGKEFKTFEIKSCWAVSQFESDYNPVHWHTGDISGVGYLKVPSNLGNTSQPNKKTNENGKLQLIFGSPNLFSKSTFLVKPELGDFYLFPNYLMHTVYPFTGTDEERRSVSFNAKVQFNN